MSAPSAHSAPCERTARRPVSIRELFTIGIGPSSSHTVGPMRAAFRFMAELSSPTGLESIFVQLYGSLAMTGIGHHTDRAVVLGLAGNQPETVDPAQAEAFLGRVRRTGLLPTVRHGEPCFDWDRDILFARRFVGEHPNTLDLRATFADGSSIERRFHSIGGGAIREAGSHPAGTNVELPMPFSSGAELLDVCTHHEMSIADVVRANESAWRPAGETDRFVDEVAEAMSACIDRGTRADGILPGGLRVRRRAATLLADLKVRGADSSPSAVVAGPAEGAPIAGNASASRLHLTRHLLDSPQARGGRVQAAPPPLRVRRGPVGTARPKSQYGLQEQEQVFVVQPLELRRARPAGPAYPAPPP